MTDPRNKILKNLCYEIEKKLDEYHMETGAYITVMDITIKWDGADPKVIVRAGEGDPLK